MAVALNHLKHMTQIEKLKLNAQYFHYLVGKEKELKDLKKSIGNHNFCSVIEVELNNTRNYRIETKKMLDYWGVTNNQLKQFAN